MKKWKKVFGIVIILTVCFLSIACPEYLFFDIDNLLFGEDYVEEYGVYISNKTPSTPAAMRDITAAQLVSEIKIGWNLGNSLDCADMHWLINPTVSQMEKGWGNPETTRANIDAIKNAGFNAIRIPVSWYKVLDHNYTIREDWMDRVTEIVNWAVDNDMYIILNTHHDEEIFKFTAAQRDESLIRFWRVWTQIAFNFRNYNEKLIFEGLNEPRTKGSAAEWTGGTTAEHNILNEYYELFVKIVRETGGNNEKRILMVNTYAASAETVAINALSVPSDNGSNKIIVSIHSYSPLDLCFPDNPKNTWSASNSETSSVRTSFDRAVTAFVSKGIPVIFGEFGSVNKNNEAARAAHARYFVDYGRQKGIPCFWWDNGGANEFRLVNRNDNSFPFPDLLAALMEGAGVTP